MANMAQVWIALLKGVNVGGGNKLPMADLRDMASALGWSRVQTYIASGNLVFCSAGSSEELSGALSDMISERFGLSIPVRIISVPDIQNALNACPFSPQKGNQLHFGFCWDDPEIDWDAVDALRAPTEDIASHGKCVYVHAPDGVARSKLFEKLPRLFGGTDVTLRNLNTVQKLAQMAVEKE